MKAIAGTKNRVILKHLPINQRGGPVNLLLVAEVTEDKYPQGVVIEVSEHDENGIKPFVKRGDTVAYFRHGATAVELNREDYFIVKEYDIYALL